MALLQIKDLISYQYQKKQKLELSRHIPADQARMTSIRSR